MRIELIVSFGLVVAVLLLLWFVLTPGSREAVYKTTEQGQSLVAIVHTPPLIQRTLGTLVFFHGGGWYTGSAQKVGALGKALAAKGYRFVAPRYRVHGRDGTGIEEALRDARDALAWARQAFAGEAGHPFAVGGGSAGGHLASVVAMEQASASVTHVVLLNPVLDLTSATAAAGFSSGELMLIEQLSAARREELSPLQALAMLPQPVLVAYGTADPLWQAYSPVLSAADMRLVLFEGHRHGFFNEQALRPKVRDLVLDFLAEPWSR